MKPRTIPVLEMCIQDGIKTGIARAYKHQDIPSQELLAQRIQGAIWERIHEWFTLDQYGDCMDIDQ